MADDDTRARLLARIADGLDIPPDVMEAAERWSQAWKALEEAQTQWALSVIASVEDALGVVRETDPRYPDVEVSTDNGRTWSAFPLAPRASLRLTCSDGETHDDGRGHLYRWRPADG